MRCCVGGVRGSRFVGQRIAQNLHGIGSAAIVAHTPYRPHGTRAESGDQRIPANHFARFKIQRVQIAHALHPSLVASLEWCFPLSK